MRDLLDLTLSEARRLGADEALASYRRTRRLRAVVKNDEVRQATQTVERAVHVAVIVGKRLATSSTTEVTADDVRRSVETAIRLARASKPNEHWSGLPEPQPLPKVSGLYDRRVESVSAGEVVEMAWSAVERAREFDARVSVVDGLVEVTVADHFLATSKGFYGEDKGTVVWGYLTAIAKEAGEVGSFSFAVEAGRSLDVDFVRMGEKAARLAVESLRAKPVESFEGTLVVSPEVALDFFSALASAYRADNVWKGSSPLAGKLGEQVVHESLTVKDSGVVEDGVMSSLFDAEGSPRRETVVIEKGVLKRYISNTYVANVLGIEATGNASSLLDVAPTNTLVAPGDMSTEELLEGVKRGIYVRRFSGDVRFQDGVVSGVAKQAFYVENGEIKHPVVGCMISGNLYDMLRNVSGASKEVERVLNVYAPTLRIEKVSILGK